MKEISLRIWQGGRMHGKREQTEEAARRNYHEYVIILVTGQRHLFQKLRVLLLLPWSKRIDISVRHNPTRQEERKRRPKLALWGEEHVRNIDGVLQMAPLELLWRPTTSTCKRTSANAQTAGTHTNKVRRRTKGRGRRVHAPDVQVLVAGAHQAFAGVHVDGHCCFRAESKEDEHRIEGGRERRGRMVPRTSRLMPSEEGARRNGCAQTMECFRVCAYLWTRSRVRANASGGRLWIHQELSVCRRGA